MKQISHPFIHFTCISVITDIAMNYHPQPTQLTLIIPLQVQNKIHKLRIAVQVLLHWHSQL